VIGPEGGDSMERVPQDVDIAIEAVRNGASIAIAKGGRLLASRHGHTVRPLIEVLGEIGNESKGAAVADKVLGRAAALVIANGSGVSAVHGVVMSVHGREALESAGIAYSFDRLVEFIADRTGEDMCPIEQMSLRFRDPVAFVAAIREKYQMDLRE